MRLDVLPVRHGGAAENMATDFMLLQRYPETGYARFRHYGWHRPAITFGYSQKIAFVRSKLPLEERLDLCRRPTGGGIVDHRNDWTYSLVIPRGHAAEAMRALESYRLVHAAIAEALQELDQPAELKQRCEPAIETPVKSGAPEPSAMAAPGETSTPGICFERAECFDVVVPATQRKIAGAAQKRNKHGLLFQGSIERATVRDDFDWETFHEVFVRQLASALATPTHDIGWPEWSDEELTALTETYATSEWNEFR